MAFSLMMSEINFYDFHYKLFFIIYDCVFLQLIFLFNFNNLIKYFINCIELIFKIFYKEMKISLFYWMLKLILIIRSLFYLFIVFVCWWCLSIFRFSIIIYSLFIHYLFIIYSLLKSEDKCYFLKRMLRINNIKILFLMN
jgi:hypothetical protein